MAKKMPGFVALVIEDADQEKIRQHAMHDNVHGDYITINYGPDRATYEGGIEGSLGIYRTVKVLGALCGKRVQVLMVEAPFPGMPSNREPHITLSVVDGAARKESNLLIAEYLKGRRKLHPFPVTSVTGRLEFVPHSSGGGQRYIRDRDDGSFRY